MTFAASEIYLDYNATAKVRPEAVAAMNRALALGGNPSSVHATGRAARAVLETARAQVAALVAVEPRAVTFVSGGTEANALAIDSAVAAGFARLLVFAAEHDAVHAAAEATGVAIERLPANRDGLADLDWLAGRLAAGPRALVCLMLANNETGAIQPVAAAAERVRAHGGWLHVDAVQAAGKMACNFEALGADTLALSGHKLGGPQGIGALVAGPRAVLIRRQHGGGQEFGRRAGTQNVPGAAGFGAAAAAVDLEAIAAQAAWRDVLARRLEGVGAVVLAKGAPRLPQTLAVAMPGFSSEVQVMALDLAGVRVSAGAACSSGKVKAGPVALAMGLPELADCALRISGGWATTETDWRACGDAWLAAYERQSHRRREFA